MTAWSATTTSPPERIDLTVSFRSDTPDVCTVSGSIVTPNAPGFCTITATQGGGGAYAPALDVARAFRAHAGSEPQTITFDQPKDSVVGQPVTLTATASSGLTVLLRSDTPDACTVSGSIVTPNAPGFCTITASQGGSDHYAAARPVRSSFQAHAGTSPQTITFDQPKDVFLGQPVTLSASTDAAGRLPVSFRSDSPTVCSVSDSEVTTVRVGICTVTAFQGGSATYAPAQASAFFHVNDTGKRIPQQISFGPVPTATVGVPVVLTASSSRPVYETSSSPAGLAVSYSSRNQQVCTVSGATVVPWTAGLCVITASQDGNAEYQPAEPVTQRFAVERAAQTISFTPPASATIDQSVTLSATASSWLPVTYSSSTPDVCKVSRATVAATAAGTCIIVASQPGDGQYAPADPVTGSIAVQKIPQTISFIPPASATVDEPVTLTATASSGLPVTYSTSAPDVCTVSGTTVTASQGGTCTITAFQPGDGKYLPATSVTQSFAVQKIPQTISFIPPASATIDKPVTLTATASSELTVSFRSDTPDVCTVSGTTVTASQAGTCTITASQPGDGRHAPADPVTGSIVIQKIPQTISFIPPASATIDKPVTLTATASSELTVSFRSDTPDVCTVSGTTVTASQAGTCTITASQPGDGRHAPADPVTGSIAVQKIPQTISFTPPKDAEARQRIALSASATSKLAVSFTSDTPGACTISGSTLTPAKAGTCTITASQAGDDRYAAAKPVSKSFPVQKIPQTISFTPPASATIDKPVTLTATASSGLPVTYTTITSGVCTVSGSRTTAIKGGTCTIIASQAGDDRYAAAEPVRKSLPVARIPQTIDFPQLRDVTFGRLVTLTAKASSGLPVTYTTITSGVCTVSGSSATTITAGTCTITASQPGDNRYLPATPVTQSFAAQKIPQTISFTPPKDAEARQRIALSASATSKLAVSFTSDTPGVCTVSGSRATAIKGGTCTIIASQAGDDRYAAAEPVRKSFPVQKIPQTISFTLPASATIDKPVTLTATASSGLPVTYTTITSGVCTVSGSSATTITAGTCAVTASQAGNDRYAPARDVQRSFAVHIGHAHGNTSQDKKASQAITFGQLAPAAVGQVVHLSASATSGLAVSFRPDTPAVCSVSGATVTTTTAGTCTVTASQAGDNRYLAAHEITQSFQIHAGHQAQTITFPQPPEAKVGEPVTLSAFATSGLVVAFQSDTPRICTVSGSALTAATAGTCAVTASQSGSDHYAAAPHVKHSFEVASAASTFPGLLTILLAAAVFAAAGATTLVRRIRRRSRRPPGPQPPSLRAAPDPGPPPLVSVKNTGAGPTHTVHIDSSPGASITTIKEARP